MDQPNDFPSSAGSDFEDDSSFARMLTDAVRLPASAPPPAVGDVISNRFRIEESLGRGGMGHVFRAVHLLTEREVAIKWLLPGSPKALRRFKTEARAAARVQHPHVVDVYDIAEHRELGEQGVGCYLVMKLLRGETLAQRLKRGPLSARELADLMLPILDGLAAAHARGIIHRDLKPGNIMLCQPEQAQEALHPMLLDFGISKLTHSKVQSGLTCARTVLGTFPYISPEQQRFPTEVDVRTDIHGLGVTMFEALTGDPFTGGVLPPDPAAALAAIDGLPHDLAQVVLKAIAPYREDRFGSATELRDALLPWASERHSVLPNPSPSTPPMGPVGRASRLTLAGVAVAALVLGGLLGGALTPFAKTALQLQVLALRSHPPVATAAHAWTPVPFVRMATAAPGSDASRQASPSAPSSQTEPLSAAEGPAVAYEPAVPRAAESFTQLVSQPHPQNLAPEPRPVIQPDFFKHYRKAN